ncbi:hypothetical protein MMC29_007776 [Sticta canariensis]|nr:hypothetical protein [Sticta canariensis]
MVRSSSIDTETPIAQGLQIIIGEDDKDQELAGNYGGRITGQAHAVEFISDDSESILISLSEPPPVYEQPPQAIDINRDGFQAHATANKIQRGTEAVPPLSALAGDAIGIPTPKLNIIIQIVGSRGDVKPFISLGLTLKQFGHRGRIATHPTFQAFVEDLGLEFFSLGGDPAELMAYMVKTPGLMPSFDTVRKGEVQKKRKAMRDIFDRCWRSCIEAGNGVDPIFLDSSEVPASRKEAKPFVADAIISNPPTFAHIHCAEKLDIPLHLMFTSPALIPKPTDWGKNIAIAGFYFLPLASSYSPPSELQSFLQAGPPPIYIGFGSIVVPDPDALTATVFEAIQRANVRALVSKGSGSIGGSVTATSPNVSCVVYHGGAGTTAVGIAAGKVTVLVPFFGDQPFWGNIVASAGAGPRPVPSKLLTALNLAAAIIEALQPATKENARKLGLRISEESGTDDGAKSFHDRLPLNVMGCSMAPLRTAVWIMEKKNIKISAIAATVLRKNGLLDVRKLKLFRPCEYNLNHGPWDPLTGGTSAVVDLFYDVFKGMREIESEFVHIGLNKRELTKDEQQAHYPPRAFVPFNMDHKFAGQRTAKGISRIGKAAVRSLMTFTVGMAQGAPNLPKVWGDKTVRSQEKITSFGSGLKAAVKELTYGTYGGVTGIFTQPIIGARDEGVLGATKGVAKGVAGVFVKPFGGASAILGYSLKGIDAEITKVATQKIFDPIVSARMAQGELE